MLRKLVPFVVPFIWGILSLFSFYNGDHLEGIGYMILHEVTALSLRTRKLD